jgi:hypothetical protein
VSVTEILRQSERLAGMAHQLYSARQAGDVLCAVVKYQSKSPLATGLKA